MRGAAGYRSESGNREWCERYVRELDEIENRVREAALSAVRTQRTQDTSTSLLHCSHMPDGAMPAHGHAEMRAHLPCTMQRNWNVRKILRHLRKRRNPIHLKGPVLTRGA